jgi:hypothetical protein
MDLPQQGGVASAIRCLETDGRIDTAVDLATSATILSPLNIQVIYWNI